MAHEARTAEASGARGDPSRPKTTRPPSARRAAQIHRPSGQLSPTISCRARARSLMSTRPRGSSVMAATSGRKASGRRTVWPMRASEGGFQSRKSEMTEGTGSGLSSGMIRLSRAPPARDIGLAVGRGGQVAGRHAHPDGRPGDRAGRCPDDQVGLTGVPARLSLERRQDADLVGLADDPAGAQHQADGRVRFDPSAHLAALSSHPPFTRTERHSSGNRRRAQHRPCTKGISALRALRAPAGPLCEQLTLHVILG